MHLASIISGKWEQAFELYAKIILEKVLIIQLMLKYLYNIRAPATTLAGHIYMYDDTFCRLMERSPNMLGNNYQQGWMLTLKDKLIKSINFLSALGTETLARKKVLLRQPC